MKLNKKGNTRIFGFFFILMIISGLLLFITVGMHYLLYDFGIKEISTIGQNLMTSINATNQSVAISQLENKYLVNGKYFDILFLVIILSAFIESVLSAALARKRGIISFFGMITFGNVFLIFILGYAIQIRGWFLNEIVFKILVDIPQTPLMSMFFNYSYYIASLWFVILIIITQIDFEPIIDRTQQFFDKDKGRFEE